MMVRWSAIRSFVAAFPLLAAIGCESEIQREPFQGGVTGNVIRHELVESAFVGARNVDVWIPPGYVDDSTKYPVVYVHDGQNAYDPAESFIGVDWGLDEAMTQLIKDGVIRPAFVVAVWNTPNRGPEYFPQAVLEDMPSTSRAKVALWGKPSSDNYLRFLVEELKPFIDKQYRTSAGRDSTFIMGYSLGALISIYALTEYPDVFGGAACVSTAWPSTANAMEGYLREHLPEPGAHKIYFDLGLGTNDEEIEPFQTKIDSVIMERGYEQGVDWLTVKVEGAEHSERAWRQRVHIPLTMFLGK